MYRILLVLIVALLIFTACGSQEEPTVEVAVNPTPTEKPVAPEPTAEMEDDANEEMSEENQETESKTYSLGARIQLADLDYTIPYPEEWFAEVDDNYLTIADSLAQLDDPPGTQAPLEGYAIDFYTMPLEMYLTYGMPEEPSLETLFSTAVGFHNAKEPKNVVETELLDQPAVRGRVQYRYETESLHPLEATIGIRDDFIFQLILHAPDEAQLEQFLPTWRQMVDGIEPLDVVDEVSVDTGEEKPVSGWEMVTSDGSNVCADGSPAAYWVHPGDEDKLLIYFQGAYHNTFCLDAENCDLDHAVPWIDPAIHLSEEFEHQVLIDTFADEPDRKVGALDFSNPDNPFIDYTAVYIPYCTGDLFMGNGTKTFTREDGSTYDINHRGFGNAQAVLDIVFNNISTPEQILVTGCEAGAPGALMQVPTLAEHYPEARITQLSEAFSGVFPEHINFDKAWNVRDNLPESLAELPESFSIADLTVAIAQQYPEVRFAQFNYNEDSVQATAYSTGGNPGYSGLEILTEEFTRELQASLESIHSQTPNFYSFTLDGDNDASLCALDSNLLLWLKGEETYFVDWLTDLMTGEEVSNIDGVASYEAR